jgi:N-acetylmuramoyl-L-alanine amidase
MALRRIWIPSPCYHGRNIGGVRLIVLHTAEGARTIEDLGHFFQNYNNQVSSHVGADDQLGKIGEYVSRGNAAWTQANYNNVAVALELCGFASWSESTWKNQHHNMLRNCADWIAEESKKLGIPITRLNNSQAQGNGRGVTQHINLGAGGGNHVDCGSGFPMDYVLNLAKGGAAESTTGDEGEDVFYLQFAVNDDGTINNDSSLSFTNEQADGKHRVRFSCRVPQHVRVDNYVGATFEADLDYGTTQGYHIPKDCKGAVVHIDPPCDLREPIAVSIGRA